MDRALLFRYIDNTWPDDSAGQLAKRLVNAISRLARQETACLSYLDLLRLAGLKDITPDFHSALTILTGSKHAVLQAYGIFVDERGEEYPVRGIEFSELMYDGLLVHPHSGEIIPDAPKYVAPVFEVIDFEAIGI